MMQYPTLVKAAAFLVRRELEMTRLSDEADDKGYYDDYDEAKADWNEDAVDVLEQVVAAWTLEVTR